jgi:hypothetical protein
LEYRSADRNAKGRVQMLYFPGAHPVEPPPRKPTRKPTNKRITRPPNQTITARDIRKRSISRFNLPISGFSKPSTTIRFPPSFTIDVDCSHLGRQGHLFGQATPRARPGMPSRECSWQTLFPRGSPKPDRNTTVRYGMAGNIIECGKLMRAEIKGVEARQVPKLGTTTNTSAETADRDAAGGVVAGIGPI